MTDAVDITAWAASDVGRVRKHNEDAYLIDADLGLYVVCDGMGGFKKGEVASGLACSVVRESVAAGRRTLELHAKSRGPSTTAAVSALLQNAVQRACEEIYQASTALTGDGGRMGTTLDAVLLIGNHAFTAHVGDGRIYLVRDGECHQVTEDHSLIQQQIREGLITPEQARKAKNKNVITRALGVFPSVLVDLLHMEVTPGDALVLCSDGLHGYVGAPELVGPTAETTGGTDKLVGLANSRGGRDNITMMTLRASHAGAETPSAAGASHHIDGLRRCDLFSFCTYRELVQIAAICEHRKVAADTILFQEDDIGRECFILEEGTVEITRGGVTLVELEPPAYFGEMSFIDSPRRSATVRTTSDSTFLVLSRNDFLRLVRQDSALATKLMWRLLHHLSRMVRNTNARVLAGVTTLELDHLQDVD
ncbi:MAG: cyclic nucleotide-binding domain-containing protein [Proteobacteria bacterium]|nr:cyclic nucleotide-binding domain-containing protein [Pseudomonadota bacterium]MCP4921389.1 cyclic nucleotide-binding domain-containing protein [Pseudomonadota bacterium]